MYFSPLDSSTKPQQWRRDGTPTSELSRMMCENLPIFSLSSKMGTLTKGYYARLANRYAKSV